MSTDKGVPQGGIISPLLSNLILHELDIFMDKLVKKYDSVSGGLKPYFKSTVYHKLTMRINRSKKKLIQLKETGANFKVQQKEYRELVKSRRGYKSLTPNPEVIKIRYVRYADD